jgi:hypothetical protein
MSGDATMSEQVQLEQAIAQLENQRVVLGDLLHILSPPQQAEGALPSSCQLLTCAGRSHAAHYRTSERLPDIN